MNEIDFAATPTRGAEIGHKAAELRSDGCLRHFRKIGLQITPVLKVTVTGPSFWATWTVRFPSSKTNIGIVDAGDAIAVAPEAKCNLIYTLDDSGGLVRHLQLVDKDNQSGVLS